MSVVLREDRGGGIVLLTLNRPEKLNALNAELLSELGSILRELTTTPGVRAVVLTGAGEKAFAAGADILAMQSLSAAQARAFSELGHAAFRTMESAPFAVIGAVNGLALGGGCELALACDFMYASERAKFGQPEVNLGVIPGFGGTQRLARRVGIARARELCFTGALLDASEALRIGLVNRVVPGAELLEHALAVAATIASKGPLAVAQAKRVLQQGEGVPLAIATELETQAFAALFGSDDQREGMQAFVQKRAATFKGS